MAYLEREANEVLYQINDQRVRRAFKIDQQLYLCEIKYNEEQKQLEVQLLNQQNWTETSRNEIGEFINDWFDLKTALVDFYAFAETDIILGPLTKQFAGLRLVGVPDFYEAIT